ncbi:hypothetical protein [Rhizobacter sp. Root404]|uniref:hypothetical protein n=1 Tax=Rhizobacter sp. Root404 TaxID=1736528 RepID=UPI0006FAD72C|nr:hypothetical protein [Rhizobacter sp. Root404]KQW35619.1 hypothetical protein ASC76_21725 [Rhizobacter sp. Root404]
MPERDPLSALSLVLRSVDALRNARALFVLLGTFAIAGILVAMAEASLARDAGWWGPVQAGAALFVAFYGGNAAGILVMDDARGRPVREVPEALRASLARAHRLLLVLAFWIVAYGVIAAGVWALFWLSRVAVTGAVVGPLLFGLAVPVGVVVSGLAAVTAMAVVVPLSAPAVWSGAGVGRVVAGLVRVMRRRLPMAALLAAVVSLLTAAMGALVTSVVMIGGRVVAELGVRVVGVDVPAQQLTAGLFGYGLRSLGAAGAPTGSTGHAAAALVGGGVVFAIALLLPGLVYLRGTCAAYLALTDDDPVAP